MYQDQRDRDTCPANITICINEPDGRNEQIIIFWVYILMFFGVSNENVMKSRATVTIAFKDMRLSQYYQCLNNISS